MVDGFTNSTQTITGENVSWPASLAIDLATNKVFSANTISDNVTVIDGVTKTSTVAIDRSAIGPDAVVVNPVTGRAYVANGGYNGSSSVTVITEQQVQAIPIQVKINSLSHDRTHNPRPTFTFTATDTFKPHATKIDNLLFQVDTWQGTWSSANKTSSGHFQGKIPKPLQLGIHTLYAYATTARRRLPPTLANRAARSSATSGLTCFWFTSDVRRVARNLADKMGFGCPAPCGFLQWAGPSPVRAFHELHGRGRPRHTGNAKREKWLCGKILSIGKSYTIGLNCLASNGKIKSANMAYLPISG